ncbi:response regulator [Pseudomonas sp. ABC1]|uniref:response regulator n=1 Tax=Pseudomonas sp. ABC1 TaxID=2748080 RepID=UPI0015C3E9A1|nr:response regulator [Pseudomonas sp. ABC1]
MNAGASSTDQNPQNWRILVDHSGLLSFDEVLEQRALFQRLNHQSHASPASDRAIWLQLSIPPSTTPHWISLFAPRVQYLDFYLLNGNTVERYQETGDRRPASARPLPTRSYLFALPNDNQPRQAFIRLQSNHPLLTWFDVLDEAGLANESGPAYLFGALFGALALLALHNLLRFALVRSSGHLWLAMLHAALLPCAIINFGLLPVLLPALSPIQATIADLSALLASFCLLGFTRAFFARRKRAWSTWLLNGQMAALALLAMLIVLQSPLWKTWLAHIACVVANASVIIVALHHWRQRYLPARLLIIGCALFTLGFTLLLPALLGLAQLPAGWLGGVIFGLAGICGLILSLAQHERLGQIQSNRRNQFTAHAVNSAELRTKAEILARISHELRTPMNGVLGMSELLLSSSLSQKQREYVQTIHSSGNELLSLINEFFDISRLEEGEVERDDVQFDLHALIEDCLGIHRGRAERQRIELIGFIHPRLPRVISGDPARLRQALLNLLENAIRHTEEGEILLSATLEENDAPPSLRITVKDSGAPLSPEERAVLRNDDLESRDLLSGKHHGRLGLIIARKLIGMMHGESGVDSDSVQGNTFWLSLPLDISRLDQPETDQEGTLQGTRLLIVDDNDTCRKVLMLQCSNWGMQVSTAASGREALALLRTKANLQEYFDAVLLDQDMPGMSGLQLAAKIKEDPNINPDLLLIMLTGMSDAPSRASARAAGIRQILAKPVAGYTLRTTLAETLAHRAAQPVQAASAIAAGSSGTARILVVEDDATSLQVICSMLARLGFSADIAHNGEEALAALQSNTYDLVLMDCEMPVMDGFVATQRLREWEQRQGHPRTPVIALTAHSLAEYREQADEAGMDDHLGKPLELSRLRELLAQWLEH